MKLAALCTIVKNRNVDSAQSAVKKAQSAEHIKQRADKWEKKVSTIPKHHSVLIAVLGHGRNKSGNSVLPAYLSQDQLTYCHRKYHNESLQNKPVLATRHNKRSLRKKCEFLIAG